MRNPNRNKDARNERRKGALARLTANIQRIEARMGNDDLPESVIKDLERMHNEAGTLTDRIR